MTNFFKSLDLHGDFLSCQALMSHALARLSQGKSDFTLQRVFLLEPPPARTVLDILAPSDLSRSLHHTLESLSLSGVTTTDLGDGKLQLTLTLHPHSTRDQLEKVLHSELKGSTHTLTDSKPEVISLESLRAHLKDRRAALLQSKQNKNGSLHVSDNQHREVR